MTLDFCPTWQGELSAQDDVASVEWHSLEFLRSDNFAWPPYQTLYDTLAERLVAPSVAAAA